MKKLIIVMVILAAAGSAQAAYTYTYGPSDYTYLLSLHGSESILFQGGAVTYLLLHDSSVARIELTPPWMIHGVQEVAAGDTSRVEMIGGEIGGDVGLLLGGDSTFSMSGGLVLSARISENAHVGWSGGDMSGIYAVDQNPWSITIFCKDYSYVSATNVLTGTWGDGTLFQTHLGDPPGTDDYLYSQIHFTIVPEPLSLGLLALGGLLVRRHTKAG